MLNKIWTFIFVWLRILLRKSTVINKFEEIGSIFELHSVRVQEMVCYINPDLANTDTHHSVVRMKKTENTKSEILLKKYIFIINLLLESIGADIVYLFWNFTQLEM